jgi:hypothetical protein
VIEVEPMASRLDWRDNQMFSAKLTKSRPVCKSTQVESLIAAHGLGTFYSSVCWHRGSDVHLQRRIRWALVAFGAALLKMMEDPQGSDRSVAA